MDATVTQLADRLLASYAAVGGIAPSTGPNLPSKSAIAAISLTSCGSCSPVSLTTARWFHRNSG
jgi:hypothetical protein